MPLTALAKASLMDRNTLATLSGLFTKTNASKKYKLPPLYDKLDSVFPHYVADRS